MDERVALSGAVSAPGYSTLHHVIDLHASQAPELFLLLPPVSHSVYSSRGVPPLYSIIPIAITPHAQLEVRDKEDKCALIERLAEGLSAYPVWVFDSTIEA